MVDWMIEVLTNFKCDDQTFFVAINLLDRYFKASLTELLVNDLHLLGVTAMFIASKYEDILPLKMKIVYEKIAHKRLEIEQIKATELKLLKAIHYRIQAPSVLDFLKVYLRFILDIEHVGNTSLTKQQKAELPQDSESPAGQKLLIQKMALYLAKMSLHDYELAGRQASLVAIGSLFVSLKICEQLKRATLLTDDLITEMQRLTRFSEHEIIEIS